MGKSVFNKTRKVLMRIFNFKLLAKGIYQYWQQIAILAVLLAIVVHKDMSLQFSLSAATVNRLVESSGLIAAAESATVQTTGMDLGASLWQALRTGDKPATVVPAVVPKGSTDDNLANTYSNMTYKQPAAAYTSKLKKQRAYISRFAEVAKVEMRKYGIPASITLAQGLIESNAGESRLVSENNNHFGIKCFSSKCRKGHCSNYTDDSHKDFFRKFGTAWESYRAHSLMLQGRRYKELKRLGNKDYKGWARGLKQAGYATDTRYAQKLINIIEELKLYQYDGR